MDNTIVALGLLLAVGMIGLVVGHAIDRHDQRKREAGAAGPSKP